MSDDTPRPFTIWEKGDDLVIVGEWPQMTEFSPDVLALPNIKTTITVTLTHTSAVYEVTGAARGHVEGSVSLLAKLIEVKP